MTRPPALKKDSITAAHSSRSTGSSPTLKVIQVPRPTAGIISPVEGIGRINGCACCPQLRRGSPAAITPAAAAPFRMLRLEDVMSAPFLIAFPLYSLDGARRRQAKGTYDAQKHAASDSRLIECEKFHTVLLSLSNAVFRHKTHIRFASMHCLVSFC